MTIALCIIIAGLYIAYRIVKVGKDYDDIYGEND